MNILLTNETFKPSTSMFAQEPEPLENLSVYRNSTAAFQLLLHDGKKNHYSLDDQFTIPDAIEIPIYRIEINSELPIKSNFIEYYCGKDDIFYGDKLLEEKAHTYSGDRFTPIYVEIPVDGQQKTGTYPIDITIYQAGITTKETVIGQKRLEVTVEAFTFSDKVTDSFHLDIWQQPSNLSRTFQVPLWSNQHFELIQTMASTLAELGQKNITVIAGEIPWKGWFNYIVKDFPANLYEYSMVKVLKTKEGNIQCDFSILDKYLACFFEAGIDKEIDVFGLLGVWQPPFFPLNKAVEHPEKLVIRYYDEEIEQMAFIEKQEELRQYFQQLFTYFKKKNIWDKVRLMADEPKAHEIATFKEAVKCLKEIEPTLQLKVAFDKEPVLQALISEIDYPVTSFYCTCQNYEWLKEQFPGKTQYYICNYPDKPNTFLHSPLTESRLQGALAYYFGTDGLLRWAYNCWPEHAREDIRYNTSSLPIGDLCLVYPSVSGSLLLSLRYKELYRGVEDFYLLKEAEKINKTKTDQLLADFLGEKKPENWMENSHQSVQRLFNQSYSQFDQLRKKLIAIITETSI